MTAKSKREYSERRELQTAGFDVHKRDAIALNHGSETLRHLVCKTFVVQHLRGLGYRVDSEVELDRGGRVDVIGYGAEGRHTIGVEVETGLNDAVREQKIEQYFTGTPLTELFFIEVDDMPDDIRDAYEWVCANI